MKGTSMTIEPPLLKWAQAVARKKKMSVSALLSLWIEEKKNADESEVVTIEEEESNGDQSQGPGGHDHVDTKDRGGRGVHRRGGSRIRS